MQCFVLDVIFFLEGLCHGFIRSAGRVCFFILLFASLGAQAAVPRRVILLQSFGRQFDPFTTFTADFRLELAQLSPEPVDFYDVALATARFDDSDEAPFVDYLRALFKDRPVDLVVPMGGPAVRFAQKYRPRLFPEVPMLLSSVDQRMLQNAVLSPRDAVVAVRHEPRLYVESILRLLPNTTNIVIVWGNSPLERFWTDEFERTIKEIGHGVGSEHFRQLSFEEMKSRAAHLPPHSAIFFGGILLDARGIPQTGDALQTLSAAANAPMFGLHDYQLGQGIVGGPLVSIRELSQQSALAAVRLLRGEAPASVRPPPAGHARPTYDWRELRRWQIPLASLPPGALIQFREPTPWDRYKWHIV
ncbi:MAG TPA: ATPase, partial [Verrucomicrobiae bacterium]|nr:ATPase [Verrucomicrobiae bacterium]